MTKATKNPYEIEKFVKFLATIGKKSTAHWIDIAGALGVHPNTITAWKQHPLAQDAIKKGIENALQNMEESGAKDWRMWEAKLRMLGVNPATKIEATIDDPRKQILDKYLGGDNAGKTKKA